MVESECIARKGYLSEQQDNNIYGQAHEILVIIDPASSQCSSVKADHNLCCSYA